MVFLFRRYHFLIGETAHLIFQELEKKASELEKKENALKSLQQQGRLIRVFFSQLC